MSHRLRTAMLRAQLDPTALAAAVGVDVKTVNRWLAGRLSHQRTRLAVADALGETEADLWPQVRPDLNAGAEATAEVAGAYAHRADIPQQLWTSLLTGAAKRVDLLGYAYPFVLELLPDIIVRFADKAAAGAHIRMAFADPDCPHVAERDALEQIGGTLPGRIRNALNFCEPLHDVPGVEIGLHAVHTASSPPTPTSSNRSGKPPPTRTGCHGDRAARLLPRPHRPAGQQPRPGWLCPRHRRDRQRPAATSRGLR